MSQPYGLSGPRHGGGHGALVPRSVRGAAAGLCQAGADRGGFPVTTHCHLRGIRKPALNSGQKRSKAPADRAIGGGFRLSARADTTR
jgi:hypothetical protein